jgi:pimeloyl-ACP methyl ester carboxylesterase
LSTLRVGGVDLEVRQAGHGPPLLLLHGPHPLAADAPVLGLLAQAASVIAPSAPGFGGSPRPDGCENLYDLVRFYLDLLDELPYARVSLVGCSFGGWLAAELAVTCSHRFERLVLADAVGIKVSGREERDIAHVFNTHPAEIERLAWFAPGRLPAAGFGFGWQQHLASISDDDLVQLARSWDALCLYGWQPYLYNPALARWLHRIHVPSLVLWGEADGIVSPAYGRAYTDLIPGARFECIPEAGHHPELEQPQAFATRVLDFLAQ